VSKASRAGSPRSLRSLVEGLSSRRSPFFASRFGSVREASSRPEESFFELFAQLSRLSAKTVCARAIKFPQKSLEISSLA